MNTHLEIIEKYNLEYYMNILITENKGNNNPYHNFYHTITVFKNVYYISKSLGLKDDVIELLLIAALFHDFNHSGGKLKDDSENIKLVLSAFNEFTGESNMNNKFIENIIRCTRFPYNKEDVLTIEQKVIRDADLLQSFEDNYIQQCLFGLSAEMGDGKITQTTLDNQINFLTSVEIFTDYAKIKYKEKLPSIIKDCEFMKEISNLNK